MKFTSVWFQWQFSALPARRNFLEQWQMTRRNSDYVIIIPAFRHISSAGHGRRAPIEDAKQKQPRACRLS
jgi:hypothetical protein